MKNGTRLSRLRIIRLNRRAKEKIPKYQRILFGTFQIKSQLQMNEIVDAVISAKLRSFYIAPFYGTEEMLGNSLTVAISSGMI